ncbi:MULTISPECIES: carboxymuconolactone decarboxylase family protein [Roseobacteraceae]|jgi:4-carboxymuconolactone decarboxylase|uniref:carboxymuconolactone decarboxylase family protein n=2 Tax=Rhodobacterales TaxID=204455 RepID=UPI0019F9F1DA|nr:carboxymuconolactone decarboxylase family protein [Roseovarius sp. 10]MBE1290482.1 carboxymuconolactone decarboxylase family protein [Paracoccaceae bacterium]MBF9022464.1 carboxymuconolactone decarboxylase family protein [Rhodobacterales bacterium FZCC0069]MBF9028420.1 carboxymuconolactone decarboxylase family protein [Rhodobacterales bacterium FZCC0188]MBF9053518.1 carboxymuconolactone decarboxylase family protein [Rhodobacterales bacterium LSUCC1028]MDB2548307.1 carboxymuconolactone decar
MSNESPQNPFEALMRQTQEMTQDFLKAVNPAMANITASNLDKLWPTMPAEMMEAFFGKQFNPGGLDAKTRLLLTLHGLTVQGALAEAQIRMTVRHAVEAGASPQEIAETIGMAAMFGGVPAMNKAMELAKAAIDEGED